MCDMYLFHFIDLLNPDFNCSNSLLSFSADEVTTGTYNLQSVISNFASVGDSIVKIKVFSQLINGISKLLLKLPKYFNGIAISTSFSNSPAAKLPTILAL